MDHKPSPPPDASVDFMLAEYEMLRERFHSLQNEGINRLNVYIALTSAVLGGALIAGGLANIPRQVFLAIVLAAFLVLASVGFDLIRFLVTRERVVDRMERGMSRVRRFFIERDPDLAKYVILPYTDGTTIKVKNIRAVGIRRTAQSVQAIPVALAAALLGSLANLRFEACVLLGAVAFVIDYLALEQYARKVLRQAAEKAQQEANFLQEETVAHHAGGPVVPPVP